MATKGGFKMDIITCPLCSMVFKDPKGLLCNHAVCNGCLSQHIENTFHIQDGHCGVSCPVCQIFSPIPNPNKPIAHWSEDFVLMEDVANEINELKLSTMAAIPALRHNLNVFCHRNVQPVPLFTLSQVNQDYTFTSTWPKRQYQYLLQDRWRPVCQFKPPYKYKGFNQHQLQSCNISSLSLFTSVVPKVMHLITESELGSKAYNIGQDVYDMIMSKINTAEVENSTDIASISASCGTSESVDESSVAKQNDTICQSETVRNEDNKNSTSQVVSESIMDTSTSADAAVCTGQNKTVMDTGDKDFISGSKLPSFTNSDQEVYQEKTETKFVKQDDRNIQYITIQHNYYTTHIHTNISPEQNPSQNVTVPLPTSELNPSQNATVPLSTNELNPSQNANVPLSTNESPVLKNDHTEQTTDFINGKLFEKPLQVPTWAIPQRLPQSSGMPEVSCPARSIILKVQEFKNKFAQSMKEQINYYKLVPNCKPSCENEKPLVSKRVYSCYKNMQDRIKFGQNWRIHARKARKSTGTLKSLVDIDSNSPAMFNVSLMTYDKNSAHHRSET